MAGVVNAEEPRLKLAEMLAKMGISEL